MNVTKKILNSFLAASVAIAPLAFVISCGKNTAVSYSNYDFSKLNWKEMSYVEATIVKWVDGDTPTVKIHGRHISTIKDQQVNIRVESIDTPESHEHINGAWVDTSGVEYEWGKKAQSFGEKVLPKGTEVRIYTIGSQTFNRIVGSIFYGPNFSKSYSVDIVREGLTLPFISDPIGALINDNKKYIYRGIADAYNEAKNGRKGIFSSTVDINKVYSIHGGIDLTSVTRYGSEAENKRHHSIYYYTKDI